MHLHLIKLVSYRDISVDLTCGKNSFILQVQYHNFYFKKPIILYIYIFRLLIIRVF